MAQRDVLNSASQRAHVASVKEVAILVTQARFLHLIDFPFQVANLIVQVRKRGAACQSLLVFLDGFCVFSTNHV